MKDDLCFSDKFRIGHEILAYLLEHPDAGDTVEGIVQWWLLERKIRNEERLVREALSELVNRGLLTVEEVYRAHARPGKRQDKYFLRYSLNRSRIGEIQEILNTHERG